MILSVIVNDVDGGAVDGTICYFRRLWTFCIGSLPVTIPDASQRLGPTRIHKYFQPLETIAYRFVIIEILISQTHGTFYVLYYVY